MTLSTASILAVQKMYADMRKMFWWKDMKKDIAGHVARCDICNRVKDKH
jgi:hypothetical protein